MFSSRIFTVCLSLVVLIGTPLQAQTLSMEALGRILFVDTNLSQNRTQSCASCHSPSTGFADPRDNGVAAMSSMGDDQVSLGDRQAPTASYAMLTPEFHFSEEQGEFVGGQFWDGRAKDLAAQAGGPPLNPIEMGMPSKQAVVDRLQENPFYVEGFKQLFGDSIWQDTDASYRAMTLAIAEYESSNEFAPFDSKYDRYLRGEYEMSFDEELGMALFFSNNNTNCNSCHMLKRPEQKGETFSNYQFHNIGVPANQQLRAVNGLGDNEVDEGLLANPAVTEAIHRGKFKVPTLRNVAVTAPYMHNGVFAELRTVLAFYDQFNNPERKLNPETDQPWRTPEVPETVSHELLKMKILTDRKINALEAFLKTLTDKKFESLVE
ncbi:cytochrome-c peroxidase [Marinobacterium sp. xm-a-152]|jgi:cytochrome c peroxidase|uniref:cytochrome-c peroxidase n=1 Tax=Marinobacterium sp. xm-a-152 TaxID=2497733 RepID=UPI001569AF3D|nr:cytochrome c peroxidase [Marinobacterium sp. xm-a-152]